MKKTPLQQLARYEGVLAFIALVGIVGGMLIAGPAPFFGFPVTAIGVAALLGVLISYPIRMAATAIVAAKESARV